MHVWLAPSAFFPHRGGVEEATLQLARELGRRGHEVLVVTNQPSPSLASNAVCEGVEVRRLAFTAPRLRPLQLASFTVSQPRLQASLDALRPRPDVVHVQCASTQTAPLLLYTRRHRLPLVLTSQGETVMDAHQIYQRSLYMRLSFRAAARAAAALTACSAWTAQHCIRYAPRFDSATIIANGVDVSQWDVEPPPSAPVLCAWGRHVPAKGFDLAIAGFALLRQQVSDARLLIGGEGVDTPRLRTLAGDGVEFVGPLDRDGVRALLGASRVAEASSTRAIQASAKRPARAAAQPTCTTRQPSPRRCPPSWLVPPIPRPDESAHASCLGAVSVTSISLCTARHWRSGRLAGGGPPRNLDSTC
jgi:glycosyltransferase involved in cell wall biosynthesis